LKKIEKEKRKIQSFDENIIIAEGVKRVTEVAVYERSKKLRDFAIQYFTKDDRISCNCCSFNFGDFYGDEIGKGFIEIHHTKPIFTYEDEDIENTLKQAVVNLTPVCSNCHRMIHRNWQKPLEIQVLIDNINANGIFK
jgi:predicted HNH restriction endonuclease